MLHLVCEYFGKFFPILTHRQRSDFMNNVLGVVVEYNPFHNGHLFHLQQSVKKTDAHITIAVMSGSFLQRGEPALTDKWTRTRMALKGGADLVIELPYIYSVQKAEIFSDGAVAILNSLGANRICFGSEDGSVEPFYNAVNKINEHKAELDQLMKAHLKQGMSYPKAFSTAFHTLFKEEEIVDLSKPNNILGYHYIKAISKLGAEIIPETVHRLQAQYHDSSLPENPIASATAIRGSLFDKDGDLQGIKSYIPDATFRELADFKNNFGNFAHWDLYFPYLQYKILSEPPERLAGLYDCSEGLEHRLKKAVSETGSFTEFMEAIKTKRYTWTRLQRLLVHLLLNTEQEFMEQYCEPLNPPYIRVLGMTGEGRRHLSSVKKNLPVPLVSRAAEMNHPVLEKDILAARIHSLPFHPEGGLQKEYKAVPVQFDKKTETFLT